MATAQMKPLQPLKMDETIQGGGTVANPFSESMLDQHAQMMAEGITPNTAAAFATHNMMLNLESP